MKRILAVDDETPIRSFLKRGLEYKGFDVLEASTGEEALQQLRTSSPDLLLLDVVLPDVDGMTLCRAIREEGYTTLPILMLTAKDALADRVHGLTAGADDYVIKPFAMAELVARIHAVLRRSWPRGSSISVDDLVINDDATLVRRGADSLDLTETERRLLGYLAAHRDRVVSKTQILTAVWGYDGFDENVVEVHISSLRRKLEAGGRSRLVHTVRGRGYLLGTTT